MNQNAIALISELLVNLAAGWIGAAVILPLKSERKSTLIFNMAFATISLLAALYLRDKFL